MANLTDITAQEAKKERPAAQLLSPMPLWQAVLCFGLPALLFRLCIYSGTPALIRWGLSPFEANVVSLTVPSAILFALAFGFYKRDGYPLSMNRYAFLLIE